MASSRSSWGTLWDACLQILSNKSMQYYYVIIINCINTMFTLLAFQLMCRGRPVLHTASTLDGIAVVSHCQSTPCFFVCSTRQDLTELTLASNLLYSQGWPWTLDNTPSLPPGCCFHAHWKSLLMWFQWQLVFIIASCFPSCTTRNQVDEPHPS